ncbi:MAG: sigma 54-interacting transcriptional regulator [Planctomycetota bacterium]
MPSALHRLLAVLSILAIPVQAQEPTQNLAIPAAAPLLDGQLAEWTAPPSVVLAKKQQVIAGSWNGEADLAASLWIGADSSHLYVAGWVQDDQMSSEAALDRLDRVDCLELHCGFGAGGELGIRQPDESPLVLLPLHPTRPWMWLDPSRAASQAGASLSGLRVVGKRTSPTRFEFEAAIPFHHFVSLRPGQQRCGLNVVLRDQDGKDDEPTVMSWTGRDPAQPKSLAAAELLPPGPLVPQPELSSRWASDLLADLPYLLVPLATLAGLVFLLRGWSSVRERARWLRPLLVGGGVLLFVVGLALPSLAEHWRSAAQHQSIDHANSRLQAMLGKLEVLGSYRGPSRDRALMELLAGRTITSQRYTSYRSLAQLAPGQFGPPLRNFDDLPVRDYWLPLAAGRPERFQFDPPLRGRNLHVVVGRQYVPPFTFTAPKPGLPPRLELELDFGDGAPRRVPVDLLRTFQDAQPLGRESWEAMATPVPLPPGADLRAVTVVSVQGEDLHLVGMSLEGLVQGQIEPLWLGEATRQGVLTDLRGPFPLDAGLELAAGATATVPVPKLAEPPQRLWFVYRAIYPRMASAVPGARVGEIVLHFAGGKHKRTLVLEHQVSVFYELAVHNTRDDLPDGSPASIALSWVDDKQERRVNLGYPVVDLPADAALEAIEFRNQAGYRMQFRSVVFVNERSSAPQNPPDSPLVRRNATEWHLRDTARADLGPALLAIYRGGRLGESNQPAGSQLLPAVLPRAVAAAEGGSYDEVLADGSRRAMRAEPLGGDGWDGAVLVVGDVDREWSLAMQFANRLGLALCLLSAPFLLVLLSELLAAAANLRFRLMAVTTVAALAPLGLLSLVLVQVLEGGHASEVEQGLRAAVRSATAQLGEQKAKLRSSAQQWLADLGADVAARLRGVDEAKFASVVPGVAAELQKLLAGQLPPDWRAGFLRLEWTPRLGKAAPAPIVLVSGDSGRASGELPTRADPGVFLQWGSVMLGVRAEQQVAGGNFALVAARPIDGDLLGTIAPGQDVLLTDVRGYPVAVAGSSLDRGKLFQRATDPLRMQRREQTLLRALESQEPVVAAGDPELVDGSDVLRDLQGTPRALLTVVRPAQRATLDLAVGRVPVRAFFLLVAGSLVVLSVFLSYVVSGRISRPIENLELSAQALSRGQFDTRVPEVDGGQIGRLTRAFNRMATDLHARLLDLQTLNRTMCELAAGEDEAMTTGVLLRFCQTQTAADDVRVVLVDPSGPRLCVHSGNDVEVQELPVDCLPLSLLVGAFSCAPASAVLPGAWAQVLPRSRSLVGLPIVFGGQARGVVVLGFACAPPLAIDLGLLGTVVAQAAVAFERGLLQRLAVHDPVTGMFTPEYFRRRVADEVSLAQQRNHPLAMLALVLGDGDRRPRGVRRFAEVVRRTRPGNAVLSHLGGGQFQAVLPGAPRELALSLLQQVQQRWAELGQQRPDGEPGPAPRAVAVQFPEEAASAEFLFDALRARLVESGAAGESAVESDEALQRAGVTAISPAMREVYRTLRRIAPTDLPILLEGETGVGKEVLTNLVHRWSRRANGPLIKVHCAALSESLLASELFGHEKGAFTGADRRKLGRFEQADGGTLFLDEVGEISLDVQVKLLRVLQEGEVERVGGSAPVRVDVRVLAATNRDIARMVAAGTFRQDLYYRLQGMVVQVPPLRERKQELAALVEQFRVELSQGGDVPPRAWSTDAMDELYRQEWPGNIRQLRNTVFRAMVLAHGPDVQRRDVLAALAGGVVAVPGTQPVAPAAVVDLAGAAVPNPDNAAPVASSGATTAPPAVPAPGNAPNGAAGGLPRPVAAADERVETVVEIQRPPRDRGEPSDLAMAEPAAPAAPAAAAGSSGLASLPPRLVGLLRQVVAAGTYSTQAHMAASGLSHRTALRDIQALLAAGALERVGSRRGAFYRPSAAADRFLAGLAESGHASERLLGEIGRKENPGS